MDLTCDKCKRITEVVCDHASGNTVCSACGLVLESRSINKSKEWQNFANNNNNNNDNDNTYLTTFNVNTNGEKKDPKKYINCDSTPDKAYHQLVTAFAKLENMADHLGLVDTIDDRGCELFEKIFHANNQKACRGRNIDAILGACLLVACQQENLPRTVKEICSSINDGNTTKKEVMRVKSFIMKQLVNSGGDGDGDGGAVAGVGRTIRAGDLVKRFCSNLGISKHRVMKAALETAIKCEDDVDLRRSPISVAAAVVYMVIQLNEAEKEAQARTRPSLKEIATVMKVGESTLRNTYKDLCPYAAKIVPSWYVNPDTIENLLFPPSYGGNVWLVN